MNTAAKGRHNEHRTIALLQEQGYATVRSAASKGLWDIVAYNGLEIVFVQVKTNGWPGRQESQAMAEEMVPANGRKVIYRWDDRVKSPQIKEIGNGP